MGNTNPSRQPAEFPPRGHRNSQRLAVKRDMPTMFFLNGRRISRTGIWVAGPLALVIVILGALHLDTARAQEPEGYVDLDVVIEPAGDENTHVIVTVTNRGTQDALGVETHLDIGDNSFNEITGSDITLDDRDVDRSTGIWNIGTLGTGRSIQLEFGFSLPAGATEGATVPLVATVGNKAPEELDILLHNNTATYWKWTPTAGQSKLAYFNLEMEVYVDPLSPAPGEDVTFTLDLNNRGSNYIDNTLYGLELDVELNGLKIVSSTTTATTTTFTGAPMATSGTWQIGTMDGGRGATIEQLVVVASLDGDWPLEERCFTASVATSTPPISSQRFGNEPGTITVCLGEDPTVVVDSGTVDLFTVYPCLGSATSTYPCRGAEGLEMVSVVPEGRLIDGVHRTDVAPTGYQTRYGAAIIRPESVIVHIRDNSLPQSRIIEENTLTDANTVTWVTSNAGVATTLDNSRMTSSDWTHFVWKMVSVELPDGGQVAIGPDSRRDRNYVDTTGRPQHPPSGLTAMSSSVKAAINTYVRFTALGTYVIDFTSENTHNGGTTSTTADDITYSATGTYTFHVGPIAELALEDGPPSPQVPADQRAFTIVATNNGPDPAPGAQVTVSGLNDGDYVSHTATKGAFATSTGVWDIGELHDTERQQAGERRDGEVLTIVTSASAGSEITATIAIEGAYTICVSSGGKALDHDNEMDCEDVSGASWHSGHVPDFRDDNNTATSTAKAGTGAHLTTLKAAGAHTAAISLEWDAVESVLNWPVTHYEVRASDPPCVLPGPGDTGTEVTGTTYVDLDVEPGDEKCYHVRAVNMQMVRGPWSSHLRVMVKEPITATAGAPDKPVLNAAPNDGKRREELLVSWTKPVENGSPIVSYALEVSDTGRDGSWSDSGATLGGSSTSWIHTGLTGGTRKFYRLRATNMCDTSDPQRECHSEWSDAVSATTDPPGQSGPPTNVRATPDGDSAIDVSWNAPLDNGGTPITRYEVQWSADGSTTTRWRSAGVTVDGDSLTFKHTGLSFMTTRYYRVAARNSRGLSVWSEPPYASATTLAGVPGQPNLTARGTDARTINLSWNIPAANGSPIVRFEIDWSADGSANSWTRLTSPGASDTSYSHGGLDPGTERHYRIRAVNSASPGEGSWSSARSAKTPPEAPGAPTLRAEANGESAIDLSWEPPSDDGGSDIIGYEIHVSTDGSENSYRRLTSPSASSRSYTHSGLEAGDERYYRVRARNSAGWGDFSQSAHGQTLTGVPRAPGLTARANGSTEIKLSWTKPDDRGSDITSYELQASDDGSEWSNLESLSGSEGEYVHTGLGGGTTKYYRVRAVNVNGNGQWSPTRSASTDAGGPDAPVLTLTVVDDNQIDLSWTEPANNGSSIRGYWVERSVDGSEPWDRLTSNNRTTTYSDTTLYRGMTRHYRVAAFNGAGTGPYSDVKSETTTGVPATAPEGPALLRFSSVGRNEVTLAWDPPGEDGGAPVSGYEYDVSPPCQDDPETTEDESETNCGFGVDGGTAIPSTSARITGLNTDGDYYFRVRAVNPVGRGEWSRDAHAMLRPSTSGLVRVSPTTINVNEGDTIRYTISLGTAPPHPVVVYVQPRGPAGSEDLEDEVFKFQGRLLIPNGWTHPHGEDWSAFTHNWSQGVRVTFIAPEDGDADDDVVVVHHYVHPEPYVHYRPCEGHADEQQCRQDWDDAWANSPYRYLTGASVIVRVRDND